MTIDGGVNDQPPGGEGANGPVYLCGPVEQADDPHTWRDDLQERYPGVEFIDPMEFQERWDDDPNGVIDEELRVCERYPILACNLGDEGPRTVGSHHEIAHALANGNDQIAAVCNGEPAGFIKHRVPVYDDVDDALVALLRSGGEQAPATDGGRETGSSGPPSCPACGTKLEQYVPTNYHCHECDRDYWKEGDDWWSCGVDGEFERVETAADGGVDLPERPYERYRPNDTDLVTAPEHIRNDREYFDHHYSIQGSLGRLSFDVTFIGEDGFGDVFRSLSSTTTEILPDCYGGIQTAQDACTDHVAFADRMINDSPEDIQDAMVVAADPLIAAAALRMWYDRQFGRTRYMVSRGDHYRKRLSQKLEVERKEAGLDIEVTECTEDSRDCASCGTEIPIGHRVWAIGRRYDGQCTVCARSKVTDATESGWTINGSDPRVVPLTGSPPGGESDGE